MSQIIKAYIAQVVGMIFILLANMVLPVLIGFSHYGNYIYVFGFTYLAASICNEGLNLLILEKRPLAKAIYRITSIKIYLALFFITIFAGYSLLVGKVSWQVLALIYLQTFFFLIQSTLVILGTLNKRNDLVIYATINNGLFLFVVPLFFVISDSGKLMPLAPLIISTESCLFTYLLNKKANINFDLKLFLKYFLQIPTKNSLYKHFIKQFIYSSNVIIFGVIIWLGVIYINQSISESFSSAFRFSMSVIGLLLGIIPFHRPTMFLLMNEKGNIKKLKKVMITSAGILMVGYLFFLGFGELILKSLLKYDYLLIFNQLQLLYFVAPLKLLSDYYSLYFVRENLSYLQIKFTVAFVLLLFVLSFYFNFNIANYFIQIVLYYYIFIGIGNIMTYLYQLKKSSITHNNGLD